MHTGCSLPGHQLAKYRQAVSLQDSGAHTLPAHLNKPVVSDKQQAGHAEAASVVIAAHLPPLLQPAPEHMPPLHRPIDL